MNIKEKLDQGYIHARTIIEVLGKPKEHVEKAMRHYIEQIKKVKGIELMKQDIVDAKQQKDSNLWATFAELEVLFKNIGLLASFCFNFMPSSIEILAPENMNLKNRELAAIINDLQAKLHLLNTAVKNLRSENDVCKRNIQTILGNYVSLLLFKSGKTLPQLSKLTGLSEANMELFLKNMIKQQKIKKEGDKYLLQKK